MKIQCWSCSEPRDDMDEFCPQCGAGPKPEIVETLAEPKAEILKDVKKDAKEKVKK